MAREEMRIAGIGFLLFSLLVTPAGMAQTGQAIPVAAMRPDDSPRVGATLHALGRELLSDPVMLAGLRDASRTNDDVTVDTVIDRDIAWRLQAKRGTGPLLDPIMSGPLSQRLSLLRFPRQALLADLMVTDDRGLLVAATRTPSDYDQSDEAKFVAPFTTEPGMLHVEPPAYDESADDYVVSASILLTDPADGRPIGVLCANFILAALQQQ